jgi:hypothetical protein
MIINEVLLPTIESKVTLSESGGSTGSLWLIDFENNTSFYIYCTWRIEQNNQVLATSNDDISPVIGRLTRSVKELEGNKLISFNISEQYDLTLCFENNYIVRVFCDISYSETDNDGAYDTNWDFSIPNQDLVISINNYFEIKTDKYYS